VVALLTKLLPLHKIVRPLLLNIGLGELPMLPMEFLCDWVLDLDGLDGLREVA
jgi:hypothetical protein